MSKSITLTNLNSGEVHNVDINIETSANKRFKIRGYKMYNNGVMSLIDVLTKDEFKRVIGWYEPKTIGYCNMLNVTFLKLNESMTKQKRSALKRKLIEEKIVLEYNKKLMINPFIFDSREDKNIHNCGYLTQRVWKYMVEDCSVGTDEVIAHAEHLFGELNSSDFIKVGSGEHSKTIRKFKGNKQDD